MKTILACLLALAALAACTQALTPKVTAPHALVAAEAAPAYIKPPTGKLIWDWQISASDAQIIPPSGAKLMDVDGFNTSAAKVAALKKQGIYMVCYLDVGSWEKNRPDSAQYPASTKLKKDPDWDEYFLDIREVQQPYSKLAPILNSRFAMCKAKGFDAVEPDNLQNAENATGSGLTMADQFAFDAWVADHVHAHDLAVFQKNDPDQVLSRAPDGRQLVDLFDAILNEQCQQYGECAGLSEYTKRGKLALDTEYPKKKRAALPKLNCTSVPNAIARDLLLTGPSMTGYRRASC